MQFIALCVFNDRCFHWFAEYAVPLQGFQLERLPTEELEDVRKRHIHAATFHFTLAALV